MAMPNILIAKWSHDQKLEVLISNYYNYFRIFLRKMSHTGLSNHIQKVRKIYWHITAMIIQT